MKKKWLVAIVLVTRAATVLNAQSTKDTVFLRKNYTSEGNRHIIYIEKDPGSWAYQKALEDDIDDETYRLDLSIAKNEFGAVPKKHRLPAISRSWRPLYLYHGKYYVYFPSDNCGNNWISINDSTVVRTLGCEGPYPAILEKIKRTGNKTMITLTDPLEGRMTMVIHLVNPQRGIAVLEKRTGGGTSYQLVVDEKKFKTFPIVVNYNPFEKSDEFEFEPVNYTKLLKKK